MRNKPLKGPTRGQLIEELTYLGDRLQDVTKRLELSQVAAGDTLNDPLDIATVKQMVAARNLRTEYFDADVFSHSPWDALVFLYEAEVDGRAVNASQLYRLGRGSATVVRWIEKLIAADLITKTDDPVDGRKVYVSLTKKGRSSMMNYIGALRGVVPL